MHATFATDTLPTGARTLATPSVAAVVAVPVSPVSIIGIVIIRPSARGVLG